VRAPELVLAAAAESGHGGGPGPPVETWLDGTGRVLARCGTRDGRYLIDLPDIASFVFGREGETVTATPAGAVSADAVRAAYRHHVLPLVLQALGLEALHASAVLTRGGVVGFCAPSGGGKSTLAVALSRRGQPIWADDALALDFSSGTVEAVRVPFQSRLRPAARDVLGEAQPIDPDARPARAPLSRLCLLTPAPEGPARPSTRLAPAAAFTALLPHAHCFSVSDRAATRRLVEHYLALAAGVPVVLVPVEWSLAALPKLVERLAPWLEAALPAAG
jgi:hypothetical protein